MIAKVRIATREQWCKNYLEHPRIDVRIVGLQIGIIPDTMEIGLFGHEEPCRRWRLTEETVCLLDSLTGLSSPAGPWHICEHLLEMD